MVLPHSSQRGRISVSKRLGQSPLKCLLGIILAVSFSLLAWLTTWQSSQQASLALLQDLYRDHHENIANQQPIISPSKQLDRTIEDSTKIDKDAPVLFSHLRKDRAGAAIQDMLLAHAFCLSEGIRYGGACDQGSETQSAYIRPLIQSLGLATMLPLACPTDRTHMLVEKRNYLQQDTALWTPEWQRVLQQHRIKSTESLPVKSTHPQTISVAVHIRRGDVDPCRHPDRYLPNLYYQRVLDRMAQELAASNPQHPPWNVTIYSESSSFESLDDFRQRGYQLHLDGSVDTVWKEMLQSTMLVMSKSSFSVIPAVLMSTTSPSTNYDTATNIIWYPPFWHKSLTGWRIVGQDIMNAAKQEVMRLRQVHCKENG